MHSSIIKYSPTAPLLTSALFSMCIYNQQQQQQPQSALLVFHITFHMALNFLQAIKYFFAKSLLNVFIRIVTTVVTNCQLKSAGILICHLQNDAWKYPQMLDKHYFNHSFQVTRHSIQLNIVLTLHNYTVPLKNGAPNLQLNINLNQYLLSISYQLITSKSCLQ